MRLVLTAFLILCAGWLLAAGAFAYYRLMQMVVKRWRSARSGD